MATFNFGETNGTSLETIDSKWAGDSSDFVTESGFLQPSTNFGEPFARYENSHGNEQSSECIFKSGPVASGEVRRVHINLTTADTTTGYYAQFSTATSVALRRLGSFISSHSLSGDITSGDVRLKIAQIAGGVIKIYEDGVEIGSYTDGTPLTGGYPGISAGGAGTASNVRVDDWTDGVSGGASIAPIAAYYNRLRTAQ